MAVAQYMYDSRNAANSLVSVVVADGWFGTMVYIYATIVMTQPLKTNINTWVPQRNANHVLVNGDFLNGWNI